MRNQRLLMLLALPVLFLRVAFPASQVSGETYFERQTNERQPPGKVLPAIGVKPGMVIGEVDDPLFPRGALDMAFMVLTYHHLAKPVDLLKHLIPSLKPGAEIVIIDPDPVRDEDRGGRESTSIEKMGSDAARAGLELVRIETFLEKDNIFILRVKPAGEN